MAVCLCNHQEGKNKEQLVKSGPAGVAAEASGPGERAQWPVLCTPAAECRDSPSSP